MKVVFICNVSYVYIWVVQLKLSLSYIVCEMPLSDIGNQFSKRFDLRCCFLEIVSQLVNANWRKFVFSLPVDLLTYRYNERLTFRLLTYLNVF